MANAFEKRIGETLQAYRDARVANIIFIHPPMRPVGMMGHVPCFVQSGKAPFDMAGIYYDGTGTGIGVELKESSAHENMLSIVGPDKKGSGIQYHQLAGLVDVHTAGGVALLLWDNGGEVGILDGEQLHLTKVQYDASLKAEAGKKTPARGSRSILWGRFDLVKQGHKGSLLWLPPSPGEKRKKGA